MPKGVQGFQKGHGLLYDPKILKGKHSSPLTEFSKGNPPPKHKKICRCFRCFKAQGESNNKWNGGSLATLKRYARTRDDYNCQICGFRDPEIMQVDHIKPKVLYPDLNLTMENLMTLCPNCHARKTNREKKQFIH